MIASDTLAEQLRTLLDSGISLEDACETLNIDVDGAKAYLTSAAKEEMTTDEFVKKHKLICLKALVEIGLDSAIENVSARVSALKVIVEGAGELPQLPVDKYSEMFKKMKDVVGKYKTETVTTPSPVTTQIDIKLGTKPAREMVGEEKK